METSAKSLPDPGCRHLALGSQSLADGVKDLFCHLTASRVFCRTHAPTSPGPPLLLSPQPFGFHSISVGSFTLTGLFLDGPCSEESQWVPCRCPCSHSCDMGAGVTAFLVQLSQVGSSGLCYLQFPGLWEIRVRRSKSCLWNPSVKASAEKCTHFTQPPWGRGRQNTAMRNLPSGMIHLFPMT